LTGEQAKKEKNQLLERLNKLGLISAGSTTEAVLSLTIKDILERRLQTIVCRKGLANSMRQARQYISHGHITIGGKQVKAPGYIVKTEEAATVAFVQSSALSNPEHPERQIEKKPEEKEEDAKLKTEENAKLKGRKVKKKKRARKAVKKAVNAKLKEEPKK